jgi:hypothetical protein
MFEVMSLSHVMPYLMVAALGAVALVLFLGIGTMVRGGSFNRRHGNRFMRWRVILQGAAILLFLLFMYLSKG